MWSLTFNTVELWYWPLRHIKPDIIISFRPLSRQCEPILIISFAISSSVSFSWICLGLISLHPPWITTVSRVLYLYWKLDVTFKVFYSCSEITFEFCMASPYIQIKFFVANTFNNACAKNLHLSFFVNDATISSISWCSFFQIYHKVCRFRVNHW